MIWVDLAAVYLLALKLLISLAVLMIFISGVDDLFVDILYWVLWFSHRRRGMSTKRRYTDSQLDGCPQRAAAIMVPAWQEAEVIARMAGRAATTLDYDNYHIFVGTYPNDKETQAEVDGVSGDYGFVHKVVNERPGPTSKADCLNNVVRAIREFEHVNNIEFEFVVMHDAEDVIHSKELKCFNFLMRYYDMAQLPVLPLRRKWVYMTSGHYIDEFAETHFKNMFVRSHLSGFVPSAGVGTALKRTTLDMLLRLHDGVPFNTESLTEDYDIGHRVWEHGLGSAFILARYMSGEEKRFSVPENSSSRDLRYDFVAIREFFPKKFWLAVRQKSRWILGIVFQGYRNIGWPKGLIIRYVLMRDRKAVFSMLSMSIAYIAVMNVVVMEIIYWKSDDPWWFPTLIPLDSIVWLMLLCNAFFLVNRLVHRVGFVFYLYGLRESLLSIPRMVWGNIINICAMYRALFQMIISRKGKKAIKWDKTSHEFPEGN